jgi:hypothetical protein
MVKRSYCWVLGIGIILVCVGVAVSIQVEAAHHHARLPQNLPVAVVQLEGCLTCHSISPVSPIQSIEHTVIALPEFKPQKAAVTPVETRLIDAGQRILALPETTSTEQVETVAHDFLQIYAQSRAGNGQTADQTADQMAALDTLEYWLTNLEYQAQTDQWGSADDAPSQPDAAAWQTVSLSTGYYMAAVSEPASVLVKITGQPAILHNYAPHSVMDEVVFGMHRRGPPAGAVIIHVGWYRGLPLAEDAQSPFFANSDFRCV